MKLLRIGILFLFVSAAFAQRGGSHGGGGISRGGGGGGFRGGSSFSRGGFSGGGFSRGFGGSSFGRGFGFRGSTRIGFGFGYGFGYPYGYGYGYGWGYPGYYDHYPYSYYPSTYYSPYPSYYDSGPVVVNQNYAPAPPAPPVQVQEYPPQSRSQYQDHSNREPLYLIALRDHRIQAAVSYWVEGDTLHYVTREHEQQQVPLDGVDRAFSEQLNRDRRVEFHLPR